MSALRAELHELIDRLPEEKVKPTLALVREQIEDTPPAHRSLSFMGTMNSGVRDLAARSQDLVRDELGQRQ